MTIDRADFLRVDGANDFPSFVYRRRIRLVFGDLFETCICRFRDFRLVVTSIIIRKFFILKKARFFLILFKMVIALQ